MAAGLPGLGLGGLFFILCALLAPFPELWRTIRGRGELAAWRAIGRQLAQALAMIAAIDLSLRLVYLGLTVTGLGHAPSAAIGTVIPLTMIGITSALMVAVVVGAKLAQLLGPDERHRFAFLLQWRSSDSRNGTAGPDATRSRSRASSI
jgi:hypothetical protein